MRFLIDNQLPQRLCDWLISRGHEAEHVLTLHLAQAGDDAVWRHAAQAGSVIITKDEDFAEWVRRARPGPNVLWVRTGNGTTRQLLAFLTPVFDAACGRFAEGDRLVEIH